MENGFIFVLIAASAIGSALMFLAFRRAAQKKLDYEAFAQAQSWHYQNTPPTNRSAGFDSFSDPADDWKLNIIFDGDGHRVEWHTAKGALDAGEAVLGMPLPPKAVAMMQSGGSMGQQILKAALKGTMHALGKTRFNLTIDEATAGDPGGVVMASDGQSGAMNGLRRSAVLAAYRQGHKEADMPVMIRDAEGLKLRRPGAVKSLDDLTELVALGKALREDL